MEPTEPLPKREQQALDLVYRLGCATVHAVQAEMPDAPSYSATRMVLQRLHKKGRLVAQRDGAKYVYRPSNTKIHAGRAALKRLLNNFFHDSPTEALSALISDEGIDEAELAQLEALVEHARRERSQ